MKHFLQFIVLIIGFLLPNMMYAQDFNLVSKTEEVFHGCATDVLHRNNAVLRQAQNVLDANVMSVQNLQNLKSLSPTAVYTIPVVIHIIHNNGAENISNAQAQTAITHLNAAFQANGNARIQFCLAQRDPQGNATTGITRNVSPLTNMTMETEDLAVKDLNRWLPTCYLNIWVVKEITSQSMGSGVVGYAYFPSAHGQNMDGLLIEAGYFGNSVQNDAVAAHEVGHYLGLYHTFEGGCPNGNCLQEGDHVCDTPPDQTTFASCAPPTNSCSTDTDDASANNPFTTDTPDYGDDYMDYSDLSCYNRFTAGQYDRMQFFLTSVRSSLLACQGCMSPCPAPITLSLLANNTNTNIGTSVTFTATATNAATYQYYINPSTSLGASQNLTYTFNTAGTFWVKCRASNGALCSAVDSVIVRVFPPGVTAFYSLTATDSVGCVTLATIFNYEILNGSTTAYLSFGDGTPNLPITGSGTVLHNYVAGVWYAAIYDNGQVQFSYPIFVHNTYIDGRYVQGYGSNPTPYYPRCSVIANGIGHLPNTGQNVWAEWNLAHDFGVSANNCSFAARLQNPSATGGAWCWDLGIGIQGSKDRAWADFMGGCQVYAHVRAGSVTIDNLAALNVDVDAWHDFKIRTAGQVIYVYYDGTMVYSMPYPDDLGTLQGIQIWFRGTGNIDNVTIADGNNATLFTDDFNDCNAEPFPCACPVLTVSHDTTICAPNAAQLTASANFTTYAWSPTAGLSNPAIRDPTATPATTTNYIVTATHLGQNLIANGDFTAGNVGFTSDYIYSSFSPGNYTVAYEWFNTPGHAQVEHTGNNGNYMSVDGSTTPNTTVWQQTVPTVLPNTDYQFTYWALTDLSAAILEVKINNVTLPITTLISDCDQTQCYWKPYTFTWNSGSNTSADIKITDLNIDGGGNDFGLDDIALQRICTATDTIKVTVRPAAPTLNLGADIAMCSSATHTFDAGAGFAEYRWQDGSTNRTFTAFGIGKYWATVKDSCGNIQSDTVRITLNATPALDLGIDKYICPNGSIALNYITNGAFSSYQWSKSGGGAATIACATCATATVSPVVSPTKYYLAATTSDGCTAFDSVQVFVRNAAASVRFDTLCFGASLTIGTNTYTSSGVYTDTFQAFNTCDSVITTNLFIRPNLSYTMHEVRGACSFSNNDGSATVVINALPNYAPYTYNWGGSDINDTLRYTGAGIYTVTITDMNGCTYTGSQTISVLPQPDYTFTQTPPSCAGFCNGTVVLTATGGSGVYTFSDTGGHTATNVGNVFMATGYCNSGLPLEYFVITLIDANGCSAPTNQITMGHQTDPIKERFDTLCFGGSLQIGTHTYTTSGVYTDTILTNCCCDTLLTTHLQILPQLTMTMQTTAPSCWNSCDGTVTMQITGGLPPYTYHYHTADGVLAHSAPTNALTYFSDTICNLPMLTGISYYNLVRDAKGCDIANLLTPTNAPIPQRTQTKTICFGASLSFNNHIYTQTGVYSDTIATAGVCDSVITTNLLVRPAAVIAATQVKPRCDGYAPSIGDGIVAVTVANLPNYAPYTFIWNTGATNDTINELPLGIYTVSVTDVNNCTYSSTAIVTRATPLVATMQATDPTCWNRCDGTIRYDIVTGTPPFRYGVPTRWTGSPIVPTYATTYFMDTICYLPPIPNMTFYSSITDANQCHTAFLVQQTAPDTLRRTQNITRCQDVPYLFNGHIYTQAGIYTDIIQTAGACDSIITTHLEMEEITVSASATVFNCFTNTGTINIANTTGGNPPYTYALGSGNFGATDNWTVTAVGTYTVFAQDANGCTASTTVAVQEPSNWAIDAGRDTTILLGDSVRFNPTLTTFAPMQYIWQPPTGLSCTHCKRPIATPTISTTYTVTATDHNGCTNVGNIRITVKDNKNVYIPNTFTPNDDGKNDFFTAFGGNNTLKINKIQIFDRWGEPVYNATNIPLNGNTRQTAWDGSFRDKPLDPNVFVYVIEVEFTNGKTQVFKGDITLLP